MYEIWACSFSPRRPISISCINEYLAINGGGNASEYSSREIAARIECFPEKSSWCRNKYVCKWVKCKAFCAVQQPGCMRYIKTYLCIPLYAVDNDWMSEIKSYYCTFRQRQQTRGRLYMCKRRAWETACCLSRPIQRRQSLWGKISSASWRSFG